MCLVEEAEKDNTEMEAMFGLGLNKQSIEDVPIHNEIPLTAIWESITELKTQSKHVAINPPV